MQTDLYDLGSIEGIIRVHLEVCDVDLHMHHRIGDMIGDVVQSEIEHNLSWAVSSERGGCSTDLVCNYFIVVVIAMEDLSTYTF